MASCSHLTKVVYIEVLGLGLGFLVLASGKKWMCGSADVVSGLGLGSALELGIKLGLVIGLGGGLN